MIDKRRAELIAEREKKKKEVSKKGFSKAGHPLCVCVCVCVSTAEHKYCIDKSLEQNTEFMWKQ